MAMPQSGTNAGATSAATTGTAILGRLMLAFRGTRAPAWLRARLGSAPAAGITLYRHLNVRSPAQLRALTTALQASQSDELPLLIAADQEGGQLLALGDGWTAFAGPMAIGATGDPDLAERVGFAIGTELRAVGINVNYAPVLDVVGGHENPTVGIRSFGDGPVDVARLGSAWLRGIQSAGVAATAKHFPGLGRVTADTHHALGVVDRSRTELAAVELAPFAAAVEAGVRMVMSGHIASPALTGNPILPATLSRRVTTELLRDELGFDGVVITDALDMRALPQDATQAIDVVAALAAGIDLLLTNADPQARRRIESALRRAAEVELLDPVAAARSAARIAALRRWVAGFSDPSLDVVGSAGHLALARELGERSMTLIRDDGLLPLRLDPSASILAVMPAPRDLTPADTSSTVRPHLAAALRAQHPRVEEVVTGDPPTRAEIAGLVARAAEHDVVVLGTISATPGSAQTDLATALIGTGRSVVTIALRTPWDVLAYPSARTHVATYSILPPSLDALAAALFGRTAGREAFPGRLPVALA
jgi:beta-N-acetylhexosaminidase